MSDILNYFDLNRRIQASTPQGLTVPASKDHLPEYDLPYEGRAPESGVLWWMQVTMYLGTVIGVLFSSAIMQFQAGKAVSLNLTLATIVLSAIIALVIMPNIYEKVVKPNAPFIVQLGLFVQQGVFWSVVFTSIGKALIH